MIRDFLVLVVFFYSTAAFAAFDVMLDKPDSDVKRLYKESTSYRVRAVLPNWNDWPKTSLKAIQDDMGGAGINVDELRSNSVLSFYAIYRQSQFIGLIHGTAVTTKSGPMQVFVAYSKNGKVRDVYFQRISSAHAPHFRSRYYRVQFQKFGFTNLPDDPFVKPPVRIASQAVLDDNQAIVRAVRLNILLVKYYYNKVIN